MKPYGNKKPMLCVRKHRLYCPQAPLRSPHSPFPPREGDRGLGKISEHQPGAHATTPLASCWMGAVARTTPPSGKRNPPRVKTHSADRPDYRIAQPAHAIFGLPQVNNVCNLAQPSSAGTPQSQIAPTGTPNRPISVAPTATTSAIAHHFDTAPTPSQSPR